MASPRIASKTPTACAACYGQYHDRTHVDFGAALEGRLIDPSKPRGGHVDWVIICDHCLRSAVALLPEERTKQEALEQRNADLEHQLAETQAYADRIEEALTHRPPRPVATASKQRASAKSAPRRNRYDKGAEA
jgi:hypothetical protein